MPGGGRTVGLTAEAVLHAVCLRVYCEMFRRTIAAHAFCRQQSGISDLTSII